MKSLVINIICTVCSVNSLLYSQVLWPVQPQNQPHSISGTKGEYRDYSRFHQGVDILNGDDYNIYAVESGTVGALLNLNTNIATIQISGNSGTYYYVHVRPITGISEHVYVDQGQLIGVMVSQPSIHVHLSSSTFPNMLAHRLCNYTDNIPPLIQSVSFRQNGLSLTNNSPAFLYTVPFAGGNSTVVYNKVDIMARVSDMIGGYTCAPSRLSYEIYNQNNVSVDNTAVCNLNFEQTALDAAGSYCFGSGTTFSPPVYNYVLTAHSGTTPYNRYWNTGLLAGATENWTGSAALNSRINDESHYPDGAYNVQVVARDVDYDNTFNQTVKNCPVVVDNFRPYIASVQVRKDNENGQLCYKGEWTWNSGVLTYGNPVNSAAFNPLKMWIKIVSSESMTDVWMQTGSFSGILTTAVSGTLAKEWVFLVPVTALTEGNNNLKIKGHDLAGNEVETFVLTQPLIASNIPIHRLDGSWSPSPNPGSDNIHSFKIELQNAPVANFTPIETTVNVGDDVAFTDLTTEEPTQWDWSFDGGDPAYSSLTNPIVTYDYEGDFIVVLHVMNQAGYSNITGIIHVTSAVIPPVAAFSPDALNISPGTVVNFADLSTGNPDVWDWDFDGGCAPTNVQNPEVIFDYQGQYTVTLKAENSAGISFATGIVNVSDAYFPVNVMCSVAPFMAVVGTPVYFSGTVIGGTPPYEFLIDPGDGSMQLITENSPNFGVYQVFNQNGDYTMTVTAVDAYGNSGTCYESVTIFGANPCASLHVDFVTASGPLAVAVNSPCTFTDQTSGGSQPYLYAWHFYPDPQTNVQPSVAYSFNVTPPPVVYTQAGNYPVSLHVYDNMGCAQTIVKDISVYVPQHCLVAKINIGSQNYHKIRKGNSCFWDFSYSLSDYNCSDPPGSGNMPCETEAEWRLLAYPSGNQLEYKHTFPNDPQSCTPSSVNDLLFEHNFTQDGKYLLKLRIWDNTCGVQNGYICEDQTSVLLDVVDCNKLFNVCGQIFLPGSYSDVDAGTIHIGGSSCSAIYMNGSKIKYHAYEQLVIADNVVIIEGAEFHADALDCPATMPCDKTSVAEDMNRQNEEPLIYPNPSSGLVTIKMPEAVSLYSILVQNTKGQTIFTKPDCTDLPFTIDLSKEATGLYILKIWTQSSVYTGRIEIIR